MDSDNRRLKLVTSDNLGEFEGPFTRMGLRDHFRPLSPIHLTIAIVSKTVLLLVILSYIYKAS